MVANYACAEEEILKRNTMVSENIKAIGEMRKKNYKAMTEKDYLKSKLKHFCLVNENALKTWKIVQVK